MEHSSGIELKSLELRKVKLVSSNDDDLHYEFNCQWRLNDQDEWHRGKIHAMGYSLDGKGYGVEYVGKAIYIAAAAEISFSLAPHGSGRYYSGGCLVKGIIYPNDGYGTSIRVYGTGDYDPDG